jgi:hypothetical protein
MAEGYTKGRNNARSNPHQMITNFSVDLDGGA